MGHTARMFCSLQKINIKGNLSLPCKVFVHWGPSRSCGGCVLQQRLADIEREAEEQERMQREAAKLKVEQIEIAEKRRNEPVTDSQVVSTFYPISLTKKK